MVQITLKASECLARNLKYLREQKGLSLIELGRLTGLSKQSIWNFENGERFPSQDALSALALFFEVEETDFFDPGLASKKN